MTGESPPRSQRSGKLRCTYSRRTTRTSMQFDWRAASGPALTTATALIAFFVDRHFVAVPNPAPLFVCIVALASSISGIASGHDQRRHCGGLLRAVLPQSPRDARLRHVGSGAHAAAGGDRCRHRPHHRPVAEKMGRRVRMGTEAPRHCGSAVGGARPGRHRHRAARFRYARGIHQPRLPRLFFAFRTNRPTASRPSSR